MPKKPSLSPEHPYWDEAARLKSQGFFNRDIAAIATRAGYPLTEDEVKKGFRRVAHAMGFPPRGSRFLMEKYAADRDRVDAMQMLNWVLLEMNEKYHDLRVELASADTDQRRAFLKMERDTTLHDIANCSIQVRKLQIAAKEETGVDVGAVSVMVGGQNVVLLAPGDFTSMVDKVTDLIRERLQAATPEIAALEQFGHENVREVTEADSEDGEEL